MKTLKAAVAKYNSISLILRILVGLAVGVVLALVAPGAGWVAEFGSLFVGALKGIAPVLVFVIVASALAQGSSRLDRRFGTVIWLYMLTTFLAAALAAVTSFMFPVKVVLADAAQSDVIPQGLGEGLTKADADVLHAVVVVHLGVSITGQLQIHPPVAGQQGEHMVQKAAAAADLGGAGAVQLQSDLFQQLILAESIFVKNQIIRPDAQCTGKIHKDGEAELGVTSFNMAHVDG